MAITAPATTTIHDGYYTVATAGGHRTFRLRTQDADSTFAPGKQVIAFLSGPCNEADYTGFAFIIDGQVIPWKRFRTGYDTIIAAARFLVQGDHHEAGKMYAMESGNCYACNRLLTDPLSIAAGIGPSCAARLGVDRQVKEEQEIEPFDVTPALMAAEAREFYTRVNGIYE